MTDSLYKIRFIDDLARKDTPVHRIHPLVQLLTLLVYLITVVSYDKYEIIGVLPLVFFPVLVITLGEIPLRPLLKRVLALQFVIAGIGILNPLFEHNTVSFGGIAISVGWLTFISIFIKGLLTVTAGILLISTTGMDKLSAALRMLKVPKLFVLQILLTYRYISVLAEETHRLSTAYSLRSPGQRGINARAWGSFAGQLLLRSFDRADRVYQAMRLRGFSGDYVAGNLTKPRIWDLLWLVMWASLFIIARIYNIPLLLGSVFG